MHTVKTFIQEDYFQDLENGPIHGEIQRKGYKLIMDNLANKVQFNVRDANEPGKKFIEMRGNQGHWAVAARFDLWFDKPTENVALQCDVGGQLALVTAFDEKGDRVAEIIVNGRKDIDLSAHKITSVVYEGAPAEFEHGLLLNFVKYD